MTIKKPTHQYLFRCHFCSTNDQDLTFLCENSYIQAIKQNASSFQKPSLYLSSFLRKKLDFWYEEWPMKVSEKIAKRVKELPDDSTFGYQQLDIPGSEYVTAAKALERLQKKGVIKKVSKGIFYKPKMTVFGELRPREEELLKPYLFEKGKRIAYITGPYLYNQLGLTTQVASKLKIASQAKRIYVSTGAIKATPVKSYVKVTDQNYQLLGFLDALKDLNIIPDVDIQSAIKVLASRLSNYTNGQVKSLIRYALEYPPRVRALLGALLEFNIPEAPVAPLKENLNPLTKFNMRIKEAYLPTAPNWNIT